LPGGIKYQNIECKRSELFQKQLKTHWSTQIFSVVTPKQSY